MRMAIIGSGGAGITAAWLLEGAHEVVVYERHAELGGHAHTNRVELGGRTAFVDDGFSWFSDALYPNFLRLLELHGVATRIVRMSATFSDSRTGRTLVLPPTGLGPFVRTLASPSAMADLLRLNRAITLAKPLVDGRDRTLTWGAFLERHRFPERFVREVLTPFIAGAWGGPFARTNDFSAYTLMKYMVFHRPSALSQYRWHVVRDGAASYVARVASHLTRAKVRAGAGVATLEKNASGWTVVDRSGARDAFDHVVVATGSRDARSILRDVKGLDDRRAIVDRFETYSVRVATHADPSFLPPRRSDWRTANVSWDGAHAALHVWAGRAENADLFTSYLGEREPKSCFRVSTFHLPLITPSHYVAQDELSRSQGRDGLWFAGDWTRDIGCHEDAVSSAMAVCEAIDPTLERLALLRRPRRHAPMVALPDEVPALAA